MARDSFEFDMVNAADCAGDEDSLYYEMQDAAEQEMVRGRFAYTKKPMGGFYAEDVLHSDE